MARSDEERAKLRERIATREALHEEAPKRSFVPTPRNYRIALGRLVDMLIDAEDDVATKRIAAAIRAVAIAAQADKQLADLVGLQRQISDLEKRYQAVVKDKSLAVDDQRVAPQGRGSVQSDAERLPIH